MGAAQVEAVTAESAQLLIGLGAPSCLGLISPACPPVAAGDIVPKNERERAFVVCVLVVGAAVYATVFANVTSLIGKLDAAGARKNSSLTAINEFFQARLPPVL